jgi:hypothetical protein
MSLRTRLLVILGVVIFVAAALFLYFRYSGQISEQKQLKSDISQAEGILTKLSSQEQELQDELSDVESRLELASSLIDITKAVFPETVQSIEYHEKFFEIADDCKLIITNLTASAPSLTKEGTKEQPIDYEVTSFTVRVQGIIPEEDIYAVSQWSESYIYNTVDNILKYVNSIASGDYFVTATVESVNITVPEPLTDVTIDEMRIAIRDGLTEEETKDKTAIQIGELVEQKLVQQIIDTLKTASATINVSVYNLPG